MQALCSNSGKYHKDRKLLSGFLQLECRLRWPIQGRCLKARVRSLMLSPAEQQGRGGLGSLSVLRATVRALQCPRLMDVKILIFKALSVLEIHRRL